MLQVCWTCRRRQRARWGSAATPWTRRPRPRWELRMDPEIELFCICKVYFLWETTCIKCKTTIRWPWRTTTTTWFPNIGRGETGWRGWRRAWMKTASQRRFVTIFWLELKFLGNVSDHKILSEGLELEVKSYYDNMTEEDWDWDKKCYLIWLISQRNPN